MAEVEGKTEPNCEESEQDIELYHEEMVEPAAEAPTMKTKVQDRSVKIFNESFEASNSEVQNKFQELIVKENDTYRCTVCEKTQSHKTKMRLHLESHLTGLSYDCPTCGKNFRLKQSLNMYMSNKHNKDK